MCSKQNDDVFSYDYTFCPVAGGFAGLWKAGLSGALAGCTFWGVMYPFDVVKSRIQVSAYVVGNHANNSILQV